MHALWLLLVASLKMHHHGTNFAELISTNRSGDEQRLHRVWDWPLKNPAFHRHLFSTYIADVRPVRNGTQALQVKIQLYLKKFLKIAESEQVLTVYLWLEQQACHLMLASWSYDASQVDLSAYSTHNITKHYINSIGWVLRNMAVRKNELFYDCCPDAPYQDISFYFVIERNPIYYVVTLFLPSAFITIVTIVGFFTPHSSNGENVEKISLGVTALLSLAIILMMVSDKLPTSSGGVPLLGQYYVGLFLILFSATCCTVLTLTMQLYGSYGREMPSLGKRLLECSLTKYMVDTHLYKPRKIVTARYDSTNISGAGEGNSVRAGKAGRLLRQMSQFVSRNNGHLRTGGNTQVNLAAGALPLDGNPGCGTVARAPFASAETPFSPANSMRSTHSSDTLTGNVKRSMKSAVLHSGSMGAMPALLSVSADINAPLDTNTGATRAPCEMTCEM